MSDKSLGEIIEPFHCLASGSADKTKVALTFQCHNRPSVTIVLPVTGAVSLQRNLAQALYILLAKPPAADTPAEAPVAVE